MDDVTQSYEPLQALEPDRETVFAGRYKIRAKLGEGGMGTVFVADQVEPVQRRVAVKIIKSDFATPATLARFEQERQALALMDHPNIAKVLDAGVSRSGHGPGHVGTPYFVMELIKGEPITKFCDEARLTLRERLELFIPVCQAVQHAHQKGVIHRDLKPSNILVGLYDGKPVPKVIDFGVAKATGSRLTQQTVYTEVGSLVGTLEYMSPEQADFNNLDIDTRTDIYALGVVLYELLTGTVPFSKKEFAAAGMLQMLLMIKEVEPQKPSTKLSHSGSLPSVAATRKSEPKKLTRFLQGDLDWIVMKALAKERERRYESASALAADVGRALHDEPVHAGPPGLGYRLYKFVRRNRAQVVTAGLVALALVVGVAGTAWQAVAATRAEAEARESARSEREAHEVARKRLTQLEKANAIVMSVFRDLDPTEEERGGPTVREQLAKRLDEAAALLEGDAVGDPQTVARLQTTLGMTYRRIGEKAKAVALHAKALDLRRGVLGPRHQETLQALFELGKSYVGARNLQAALPLLEQAYGGRKEVLGAEDAETLKTLSELAYVYTATGQKKGKEVQEEAYGAMKRVLGPDSRDTLECMSRLGMACSAAMEDERAEKLFAEAYGRYGVLLGPDHFETSVAAGNLAATYLDQRKLDKAIALYQKTLEQLRNKVGVEHPFALTVATNLGYAYREHGDLEKARRVLEETMPRLIAKQGIDHPETLRGMRMLALTYERGGQWEPAIAVTGDFHRRLAEKHGANHGDVLDCLAGLARLYRLAGQLDEAVARGEAALQGLTAKLGPENGQTMRCADELGLALLRAEKYDQAASVLGENLTHRMKAAADDWKTFNTKSQLGGAYLGRKKYADAVLLLQDGYEGLKRHQGKIPPDSRPRLTDAVDRLIRLYGETGKPEEAKKWQEEKDKLKETQDKGQKAT